MAPITTQPTGWTRDGKPMMLLDASGRPLRAEDLHKDDRQAIPQALTFSAIIRGAHWTYLHMWDEAMRSSHEHALAMRRDPFLMLLLHERKEATAGLKWHVEPDNARDPWQKAVAAGLGKIVRATPHLRRLHYYLLESIWYGRYAAQLRWHWRPLALPLPQISSSALPGMTAAAGPQYQTMKSLCVRSHSPVNGDKLNYFHDHKTPYLLINAGYANEIKGRPEIVTTSAGVAAALTGDYRDKFLIHTHDPDDADYFEAEMSAQIGGVGIRSRLYFLWFLRNVYLEWISDTIERTGLGVIVVRYPSGDEAARVKAEEIAKNLSRKGAVTIPVTPDGKETYGAVEIVEAPIAGAQWLHELRLYIDGIIERYVVGQSASGGIEGRGGGGAAGVVLAERTKFLKTSLDAHALGETLTGSEDEPGLISTIKQAVYPWADFPCRHVFDLEDPEVERKLGAISMFINLGGAVLLDEVRGLIGLSEPGEDDDVLSLAAVQQQQMEQAQQAQAAGLMPPGGAGQPGQNGQAPGQGQGPGAEELANLLGEMQSGAGEAEGGRTPAERSPDSRRQYAREFSREAFVERFAMGTGPGGAGPPASAPPAAPAPTPAPRPVGVAPPNVPPPQAMHSQPAYLRPGPVRRDIAGMRAPAPAPPGQDILTALGRAHLTAPGHEATRMAYHDALEEAGQGHHAAMLREPHVKSQAVPDPARLEAEVFRGDPLGSGQLAHHFGYHEAAAVPRPGEELYLRGPGGEILGLATASPHGHEDTGQGVRVNYDVRRAVPGQSVHRPESHAAYDAGYQHLSEAQWRDRFRGLHHEPRPDEPFPATAAAARRTADEIRNSSYGGPAGARPWDDYADHLAAREAVAPHDAHYYDLGRQDAESLRPYAHSVEGMRAADPADDQDRWAMKHAEGLRTSSLGPMFRDRGLPEAVLNAAGAGPLARSHRVVGGANADWRNPVVHTLLDEAYPRWQEHLAAGGPHGRAEFEKILGRVIDQNFPPDEHPHDSLMNLLDRTGNPHDVDREDYSLQQEKRTADAQKALPVERLLGAESAMRDAVAASRGERLPEGGHSWAREILRRVKAWRELPEAVRQAAERHGGSYGDLHTAMADLPIEQVNEVVRRGHAPMMAGSGKWTLADAATADVMRMAPVARAFERHRQGGGAARHAREGPPRRYAVGTGPGGLGPPPTPAPAGGRVVPATSLAPAAAPAVEFPAYPPLPRAWAKAQEGLPRAEHQPSGRVPAPRPWVGAGEGPRFPGALPPAHLEALRQNVRENPGHPFHHGILADALEESGMGEEAHEHRRVAEHPGYEGGRALADEMVRQKQHQPGYLPHHMPPMEDALRRLAIDPYWLFTPSRQVLDHLAPENRTPRAQPDDLTGRMRVQYPLLHTLLDEVAPHLDFERRHGGEADRDALRDRLTEGLDRVLRRDLLPAHALVEVVNARGNPYDVGHQVGENPGDPGYTIPFRRRLHSEREMMDRPDADFTDLPPHFADIARTLRDRGHSAAKRETEETINRLRQGIMHPHVLRDWTAFRTAMSRLAPAMGGAWDQQALDVARELLRRDLLPREQTPTEPGRYARAGPGDFDNPGAMAPAGEGVDFPGQYPQQGPIHPPQPWQLQARQPSAGLSQARQPTAGLSQPQGPAAGERGPGPQSGGMATPQEPPPQLPEHEHPPGWKDPADSDPDAFRDFRVPRELREADLDEEAVRALMDLLGEEGFAEMMKTIKEAGDASGSPPGPQGPPSGPAAPLDGGGPL